MRSGWCPPDVPHAAAHKVCQMRQDDGLLGPCECEQHGGHASTDETKKDAA
jgi:hypothetical protein